MLNLTRTGQMWTAEFSNGHLFNESYTGHSPCDALRGLSDQLENRHTEPVVWQMTNSIRRIKHGMMFEGHHYMFPLNLAEH